MARASATARGFGAAATTMGGRLDRAGKSAGRAGSFLTRSVTLPLLAAGGASVKMALDYDKSITQIVALTGVARKEVEGMKDEVLALSGATAQSPKELADALYFIISSGIAAKDAMAVLTASAKASAAGLGETMVIADAATSVMNAYGAENVSAARAVDIMTAAIKFGKVEADAMGPVIGRIVPTAAALGIAFEDVAGTMATLSMTGTDAAEAATQIGAVFSALLADTPKVKDALKSVGLEVSDLREVAGDKGLIAVMRLLDEAFEGNIEQMRKVFPNVRAFRGVMNALAQDSGNVDTVMRGVANSVGDANTAFEETTKSDAFQMDKMLNDLRVEAVKLGQDLLPIAKDIVGTVRDMVQGFRDLSPETRSLAIKLGLVAIAAGPVLRLFGGILRLTGGLAKGLGFLAGGMAKAGAGGAAVGAGAKAGAGGLALLAAKIVPPIALAAALGAAFYGVGRQVSKWTGAFRTWEEAGVGAVEKMSEAFRSGDASLADVERGVRDFNAEMRRLGQDTRISVADVLGFADGNAEAAAKVRALQAALIANDAALNASQQATLENFLAVGDFTSALNLLKRAYDEATRGAKNQLPAEKRRAEAMADSTQRAKGLASALRGIPSKVGSRVDVNTAEAQRRIDQFIARNTGRSIPMLIRYTEVGKPGTGQRTGHGGMTAGSSGPRRLHAGSAGPFRANEVPAILLRNEEVLSPRESAMWRSLKGALSGGRMRSASASPTAPVFDLTGLRIKGRLKTDFGIGDIDARIEEAIDSEAGFRQRRAS